MAFIPSSIISAVSAGRNLSRGMIGRSDKRSIRYLLHVVRGSQSEPGLQCGHYCSGFRNERRKAVRPDGLLSRHTGGRVLFLHELRQQKRPRVCRESFGRNRFLLAAIRKQVRVEGTVERLSPRESDLYFQQRPFKSQITALLSRQSHPLPDPGEFLSQLREAEQAHDGKLVPRP